jgi:hypothetical protein
MVGRDSGGRRQRRVMGGGDSVSVASSVAETASASCHGWRRQRWRCVVRGGDSVGVASWVAKTASASRQGWRRQRRHRVGVASWVAIPPPPRRRHAACRAACRCCRLHRCHAATADAALPLRFPTRCCCQRSCASAPAAKLAVAPALPPRFPHRHYRRRLCFHRHRCRCHLRRFRRR